MAPFDFVSVERRTARKESAAPQSPSHKEVFLSDTDLRPEGMLTIRTIAMPADLNYEGDVFGGWMLSQMDLAGGIAARWRAQGRVATVAITAIEFHVPVKVGDELSCYCQETRCGRTSLIYRVESWIRRRDGGDEIKATEGTFTYVAIGPDGRPRPIPPVGTPRPDRQ